MNRAFVNGTWTSGKSTSTWFQTGWHQNKCVCPMVGLERVRSSLVLDVGFFASSSPASDEAHWIIPAPASHLRASKHLVWSPMSARQFGSRPSSLTQHTSHLIESMESFIHAQGWQAFLRCVKGD